VLRQVLGSALREIRARPVPGITTPTTPSTPAGSPVLGHVTTAKATRQNGLAPLPAVALLPSGSMCMHLPLCTIDDVESATVEWVDWYNRRLQSQLTRAPRDVYETA
jgi:hypothetical protein